MDSLWHYFKGFRFFSLWANLVSPDTCDYQTVSQIFNIVLRLGIKRGFINKSRKLVTLKCKFYGCNFWKRRCRENLGYSTFFILSWSKITTLRYEIQKVDIWYILALKYTSILIYHIDKGFPPCCLLLTKQFRGVPIEAEIWLRVQVKSCRSLTVMVTSRNEWKIIEWVKKPNKS